MADDKTKTGGQDRTRINSSEEYEVGDWVQKFGVSPQELKDAVQEGFSCQGKRELRFKDAIKIIATKDYP